MDCLALNLGTGGQISVPTSRISCENGCETRPRAGGGLLRVGASLCGGWSYAYLATFFRQVCREIGDVDVPLKQVYDRMTEIARNVTRTGLAVDTRFAGQRSGGASDTEACGAIRGIDVRNLAPSELTHAFKVGMVRELAELAGSLVNIREVVASGNAVRKTPGLVEVVEKVFGLPCTLASYREEAACGVALWMLGAMGNFDGLSVHSL